VIISTGGMNADALNTLDVNQRRFISKRDYDELVRRINEPPDPKTIEKLKNF
jgi:hypothetical protein